MNPKGQGMSDISKFEFLDFSPEDLVRDLDWVLREVTIHEKNSLEILAIVNVARFPQNKIYIVVSKRRPDIRERLRRVSYLREVDEF